MSLKESFFEAVFGSSFGTTSFDCGIHTNISVNHFVYSNGAPAKDGTAKLSGVVDNDRSALPRTLYGSAIACTSAVDLVAIAYAKVSDNDFFSHVLIHIGLPSQMKSRHNLATCVRLVAMYWAPKRWFCKIPSTLLTSNLTRFPMWRVWSLRLK